MAAPLDDAELAGAELMEHEDPTPLMIDPEGGDRPEVVAAGLERLQAAAAEAAHAPVLGADPQVPRRAVIEERGQPRGRQPGVGAAIEGALAEAVEADEAVERRRPQVAVGALGDPFDPKSFVFRTVCGLVFTAIYQVRGFAPAVWTHALYDIWVLVF